MGNQSKLSARPADRSSLSKFIHSVRVAILIEGGLIKTVKTVYNVLTTEGWSGFRNRVRDTLTENDRSNYAEWVRRYDTLDNGVEERIKKSISQLATRPLISVLMPTYNPPIAFLEEAISSVREQLYEHWELCIADDASTDPAVRKILEHAAATDERIKVTFREENGHISAASNSALALSGGEWIALMDHDDVLAKHALFCIAETIHSHSQAKLIYTDEDKINEHGFRFDPYFKSDFNPELFFSQNMICHLGVYHGGLIREIGGFREGFEGAQDHDLALRCLEHIEYADIVHIPRVLYHWRVHSDSTSSGTDIKPYAVTAGERAISEHFERRGIRANVDGSRDGYHVRYALPNPEPLVTLIIPTRNGMALLRSCIESIEQRTRYKNYEILVVDNGSDDPEIIEYFTRLQCNPRISIKRDDRPFNFGALNNKAVLDANGEFVALINNDIEVIAPEWLSEMVALAALPHAGVVGAKLLYTDGTIQHAGVVLGVGGVAGHAFKHLPGDSSGYFNRAILVSAFSASTAACLVIKKSKFLEAGGFEEINLAIAFNDVDFCLRVREAGYRNLWTPHALLYHHESATRGYEDTEEKQQRFAKEVRYMQKRWGELLVTDPAYSPNLTLALEDFSFAWPPRVRGL